MLTEIIIALLAVAGFAGTIVAVSRDGYRRIPTRRYITLP